MTTHTQANKDAKTEQKDQPAAEPLMLRVSEAFTRLPGPRYRRQGAGSGEQLRDEHLTPLYERARRERRQLAVDLDGSEFGYPIGFIEEAFGGLAREHGAAQVLETIEIRCTDIPEARADAIECIEGMLRPDQRGTTGRDRRADATSGAERRCGKTNDQVVPTTSQLSASRRT